MTIAVQSGVSPERRARPARVRELVTQAEYARLRGCSRAAVTKAAQRGAITLFDGLVDPVEADRTWPRAAAPAPKPPAGAVPPEPPAPPASGNGASPPRAASATSRPDGVTANEAKAELDWTKAQLAQLELAREQGRLLEATEVEKSTFEAWRAIRDGLLSISDRECAALARETTQDGCRRIVHAAILRTLTELSASLRPAD